MNTFDELALSVKCFAPGNEVLFDDQGMPSIMVKIPKQTYAQLGLGASTSTFPAWIVNGQEVDYIYISKYMNIVKNSRAYSLPGQDYANNMTFDQARQYCENKGAGWHLMTALEWGALIAWCENNGFIPLGNCAYGKYHTETNYKAIPMTKDGSGNILHTAGGTGPLTWYHDQTPSGIADLCGNGWEWTGGIRTVKGELQILVNNNAADSGNSQAADAAGWKAIKASDGTLITPNGSGTTSGSVKMDWVSSKLQYNTSISTQADTSRNCLFKDINCHSNIGTAAKDLLIALGMHPKASSLITTYSNCYFNNGADERAFFRGGTYNSSSSFGFASFIGYNGRDYRHSDIGFRAAFVQLPAA